jgi:hypothetical protein
MGELYLDQIDRILLQKYEESRAENHPEETEKTIDNPPTARGMKTTGPQVEPTPEKASPGRCRR